MTTATYTVIGMTCQHCVNAVTGEVAAVPGVDTVEVDLDAGLLTVTGTDVPVELVRTAVDEAGYELADTRTTDSGTTDTGLR